MVPLDRQQLSTRGKCEVEDDCLPLVGRKMRETNLSDSTRPLQSPPLSGASQVMEPGFKLWGDPPQDEEEGAKQGAEEARLWGEGWEGEEEAGAGRKAAAPRSRGTSRREKAELLPLVF